MGMDSSYNPTLVERTEPFFTHNVDEDTDNDVGDVLPCSPRGNNSHSNKRNPFRWTGRTALAQQESSSSPRYDMQRQRQQGSPDPLLMEMDVSPEVSSEEADDPSLILAHDLEKIRHHLEDYDNDEEELEETEALTLSFASGMALSCTSETPDDAPTGSPRGNPNHRSSSSSSSAFPNKLHFSSIPDQFVKSVQRRSAVIVERPVSASLSPIRWSRKLAEVASSPLKDRRFQRIGSGGGRAEDFQAGGAEDEIEFSETNEGRTNDDMLQNNVIGGMAIAFPGLETEENTKEAEQQIDSSEEEVTGERVNGGGNKLAPRIIQSSKREQGYYPPPPLPGNWSSRDEGEEVSHYKETNADYDIVLNGLQDFFESPRRREPTVTSEEGESEGNITCEVSPGVQSLTKMRSTSPP